MSAETFFEEPQLINPLVSFDEDRTTNELIIKQSQDIPTEFLSDNRKQRIESTNAPAGDFHHVASIPVAVVDDLMLRYGFDVMNAPVRETLKMLQRYALDDFITTNKRI